MASYNSWVSPYPGPAALVLLAAVVPVWKLSSGFIAGALFFSEWSAASLEPFHIGRKQKPLEHFAVVAFSDGNPDSSPAFARAGFS